MGYYTTSKNEATAYIDMEWDPRYLVRWKKPRHKAAYLVRCYLYKNNSLYINVLVASGKGSWVAEWKR